MPSDIKKTISCLCKIEKIQYFSCYLFLCSWLCVYTYIFINHPPVLHAVLVHLPWWIWKRASESEERSELLSYSACPSEEAGWTEVSDPSPSSGQSLSATTCRRWHARSSPGSCPCFGWGISSKKIPSGLRKSENLGKLAVVLVTVLRLSMVGLSSECPL